MDPMIPGSRSPRKSRRESVDDDPEEESSPASKRLPSCDSADDDVIKAARSERTAQLLLRFSDTIERAKHKMDDGSTRVPPLAAGGGSSSSSRTRAHKREEQSPDEQLPVEAEVMPIKCRLTPEMRHQMLNAVLSKISNDSLLKRKQRTYASISTVTHL